MFLISGCALETQRIPTPSASPQPPPPPVYRCRRLRLRHPRGAAAALLALLLDAIHPPCQRHPPPSPPTPAPSRRGASSAQRSSGRHRIVVGSPPHGPTTVDEPADPAAPTHPPRPRRADAALVAKRNGRRVKGRATREHPRPAARSAVTVHGTAACPPALPPARAVHAADRSIGSQPAA